MNIPKIVHESWHPYLQSLFDDLKMSMILDIVNKTKIYPEKKNVFKVFSMPIDEIRVVILGQDPYSHGEATGLAFGVDPHKNTPKSLMIIKNEITNTVYKGKNIFSQNNSNSSYPDIVQWKTLEHWSKQGVFLLNSALTVQAGQPNSHMLIWQWFTREVISAISKKGKVVWLLWGTKAQSYLNYIDHHTIMSEDNIEVVTPNNGVLLAPHPAAESYNPDTPYKFTGCNHFELCNKILENNSQRAVKW